MPPPGTATVDATRGLADRLGLDDDGRVGDAVYDALASAALAPLAALPGGWLYYAVPDEVVVNTMAFGEGVMLGVFDARPDTLDAFVDRYWTLLGRSALVASGAILFTDGFDLLAGMGEGIVEEFTDLWKMFVALFSEDTWTKVATQVERAMDLLLGARDQAVALGWQVGQAVATAIGSVLFGPQDQFARALGKLLGPIVLEIAIGLLTGGAGLVAFLAKYGVKAGRVGLHLAVETIDLIGDVASGVRRLPPVDTKLDDVLRLGTSKVDDLPSSPDAPPMSVLDDAPVSNRDRGLDLGDDQRSVLPEADRSGSRNHRDSDAESREEPDPRRRRGSGPRRATLTPEQLRNIEHWSAHYAGTNPSISAAQLSEALRKTVMRWGKLDIDDVDSLREVAKLISQTRRRQTNSGRSAVAMNRVASAGELRTLERLNDAPAVERFRMLAAPSGQKTPDIAVEFHSGTIGDFDVEVRTVTQMQGTPRQIVDRHGNERTITLPARDPDPNGPRVMPTKSAFSPDSIAGAFEAKMQHGQLADPNRPGRGVIAVNIRQTPTPDLLPQDHIDRLVSMMDDHPEVQELWLIGPGGIEPVVVRPGSDIWTVLQSP